MNGSDQSAPRKRVSVLIGLVGALLLTSGFFFHAFRTGLFTTAFTSLVCTPLAGLIFALLVKWLRKRKPPRRWALVAQILFWLAPAGWVFADGYRSGLPPAMFQLFFKEPMPASVHDFAWRGAVLIDGNYEVYFAISPDDAHALIATHRMVPASEGDQPIAPGTDTEIGMNAFISSRFSGSHMPVVQLKRPIVYLWKGGGGAWRGYLITDERHEHVYLRLAP